MDEINETAPDFQVRLLRVLETNTYARVGGECELWADVRIAAETNRDPLTTVRDRQLREDLMYCLAVFLIELPPLRARGKDVELLAHEFVDKFNSAAAVNRQLAQTAIETLRSYS